MGAEIIGKQIQSLRKERGYKQEELANAVGVSTQAVSKWENGGVPDTELLPAIANFFGTSIDRLFNRPINDYTDSIRAVAKRVHDTPQSERIKLMLNYCFDMQRAAMTDPDKEPSTSVEEYEKSMGENEQRYSSLLYENGFTRMGIANRSQYFLIVPDAKSSEKAYFEGVDYVDFFKDVSDRDFFDACVFFHRRECGVGNKAFTTALLVKNFHLSEEKANEIINTFKKYRMVHETQIEMDDEMKTVYTFESTPSFVALLIFTREIIKKPGSFSYFCSNRNEPYLK